jgi:hypothetical protein
MAGDWIKMSATLRTNPKVVRISSALKADRLRVVGGLHAVWCLFDAHSLDGSLDGYSFEALDDLIGWPGFSAAMRDVGWLTESSQGVDLPRFDEHNGQSAKRRAQETERKRVARAAEELSALDADEKRSREEKRREENKETTSARPTVPCPYKEIESLYHAKLPSLPRVRLGLESRQKALRSFWGWVLSSTKSDGTARATNAPEALAWIAGYFERANANDFLMGRTQRTGEHANWQCDLDFLLTDKGKKQVIEKTREAA